ncbi:four-carbon acid sugar kinase family protein [Nonomuraea insulae]|uniref:Four-carbon acid sugar kinase family protein n=1 Tax=Nonomuraea insulae TaxID=1616787 RepID=A0ABW1CV97_9ACTN
MRSASVFALADDLSGAAEIAAVLMSSSRPARIALSGPPYLFAAPVVVADLDSRYRAGAGELVGKALRHAGDRRVFIKIDSLLRGNVATTTAAALTSAPTGSTAASAPTGSTPGSAPTGPTPAFVPAAHLPDPPLVVLAPALPSAGRVVVGGVPYIGGVPLRETRAWHAEGRPAPASVAEVLDGVPSVLVPLATIRAARATLARVLSETAGRVAVCDAETDADLDAIVTAALTADPHTRFIGAGGLAAALGRTLDTHRTLPAACGASPAACGASPAACGASPAIHQASPAIYQAPSAIHRAPPLMHRASSAGRRVGSGDRALLVVVGTAEPGAAEQARLLLSRGAHPVTLDAATDLDAARRAHTVHRLREALTMAVAVLTIGGQGPPDLSAALAEIVRTALTGHDPAPDLVLTGGETARRVLDALEVRELTPVGQIHHGAVHSHTPQGRSVVTRPGSFGERDSLLRIAAHLRPDHCTLEERPK